MWRADVRAPFTKQSFEANPPPTAYFNTKKREEIQKRILDEETVKVHFNSKSERPCMQKIKPTSDPGPGAYIKILEPRNSSRDRGIRRNQTQTEQATTKIDLIGSNSQRDGFWIKPREGPAPG